jgi:hypothetical protein
MLDVVRKVHEAAPRTRQLLLGPFDGQQADNLRAVVAAMPVGTATFGDTKGFYSGDDGLHPFGYSHVADITPSVVELCLPLLAASARW